MVEVIPTTHRANTPLQTTKEYINSPTFNEIVVVNDVKHKKALSTARKHIISELENESHIKKSSKQNQSDYTEKELNLVSEAIRKGSYDRESDFVLLRMVLMGYVNPPSLETLPPQIALYIIDNQTILLTMLSGAKSQQRNCN